MKTLTCWLFPLVATLPLVGCGTGGTAGNGQSSGEGTTGNGAVAANDADSGGVSAAETDTHPEEQTEPSAEDVAIAALETLGAHVMRNEDGAAVTVVMSEQTTDDDLTLLAELGSLRALSLGGTQITDAGLETVGKLVQLKGLYLYDTQIGDAGLAHLKDLDNLRQLSLAWTDLTDEGLRSVGSMSQLAELDIARTEVTDSGLTHLEGLKNLEAIDTAGSEVSDKGIASLKQAIPDVRIAEENTVARAPGTPAPLDLDAFETPDEPEPSIIGQAAPEIEGEDIDGVIFKLSDYRGKVVMLDFWGDW